MGVAKHRPPPKLGAALGEVAEHDLWLSANKTSVQIPIYHIHGAQSLPIKGWSPILPK